MATDKERKLFEDRLKKLEALRKQKINPYPAETKRTHSILQVLEKFASLAKADKRVVLTGRIRAIRAHGGLVFGQLEDGTGRVQFMLREDELGQSFADFEKFFDLGDFAEFEGKLLETKRGEKTLLVSQFRMLAKALRALPDKWHGLADLELRLRKRYLDLLANPATRELFIKKSKFWQTIREFLQGEGFLEVDTPVFEHVPGGADAEPFVTHYNALDEDFYLRISLELPLKRLLVGGYERVFEIGRIFRNEGISREHLQEYTQMEFYWAYHDYHDVMAMVERMYKHVIKTVTGGFATVYDGQKISWGGKWPTVDYFEIFEKQTGIDLNEATSDNLLKKARQLGEDVDSKVSRGRLVDAIYKKTVRPKLIQPCYLTGHPVDVSPLSKQDPKNPKKVLRFQVLACGTELGNGWAELNDPLEQRARFEEQMKLRAAGDKEAQMMDEDYVEALEYGMPPAVGFGLSERLFAALMDKPIREVVIFPPMRKEKG